MQSLQVYVWYIYIFWSCNVETNIHYMEPTQNWETKTVCQSHLFKAHGGNFKKKLQQNRGQDIGAG